MNKIRFIPTTIFQLIKIYVVGIVFFSLFRLILFFTEIGRINNSVNKGDIVFSFIMGLRFDIAISGYLLVLPFSILVIFSFINHKYKIINKIALYFISMVFSVAFMVCAIDIPYFNQFFARLTVSAFEWLDNPEFVFNMIVQEPRYWWVVIPLLLIIYSYIKIIKSILSNSSNNTEHGIFPKIVISVIFLGLVLLGIRGRIEEKSPIRVGTAYFSNNAFLNQLGLNPNFTLIKSYLDSRKDENKRIRLIDDELAIANVQKYLNIKSPDKKLPLFRKINCDSTNSIKYNVVIIIMESMSAAKMGKNNLTPFLDKISEEGYHFTNAYTAGIHTFNGIFSTLFSFPALFRQQPMKESSIIKYNGIFSTLKENGYSTIFFIPHDGQFDNVEGFLKANDCESVISKPDYPADKVKTTLGVPDDFMFEFSIPILNKLYKSEKPFLAAFMTASDHGPYYIPEYFKPTKKSIKDQIVEYADYSLKKFIELSSKQKWFKNTIFVFVADHGSPIDGLYDMSIDYNHTPLIFYAPGIFTERKTFSNMAGQIDVFPTIMGLLQLPYVNNTLGIDLLKESRPYIFFNADDKYGVIDNEWFLIVRNTNTKSLYRYRNKDTHDYSGEKNDIADKMNIYAQSNLQAYQIFMLRGHKLSGDEKTR